MLIGVCINSIRNCDIAYIYKFIFWRNENSLIVLYVTLLLQLMYVQFFCFWLLLIFLSLLLKRNQHEIKTMKGKIRNFCFPLPWNFFTSTKISFLILWLFLLDYTCNWYCNAVILIVFDIIHLSTLLFLNLV